MSDNDFDGPDNDPDVSRDSDGDGMADFFDFDDDRHDDGPDRGYSGRDSSSNYPDATTPLPGPVPSRSHRNASNASQPRTRREAKRLEHEHPAKSIAELEGRTNDEFDRAYGHINRQGDSLIAVGQEVARHRDALNGTKATGDKPATKGLIEDVDDIKQNQSLVEKFLDYPGWIWIASTVFALFVLVLDTFISRSFLHAFKWAGFWFALMALILGICASAKDRRELRKQRRNRKPKTRYRIVREQVSRGEDHSSHSSTARH